MRRLHHGLGEHTALAKDVDIIVFFAPASSTATFPSWRCKVLHANDDALVVEYNGKMIGLSWDHIAGIQFA